MMAMNEETKAVYAKYGVSPTGSCAQLLIQMPILLALYQVIMRVPAYVSGVKEVFTELSSQILAAGGSDFMQELAKNGAMSAYVGKILLSRIRSLMYCIVCRRQEKQPGRCWLIIFLRWIV